jgi:bifunctional UDP-N-acetylglucosamine pyrophosphorylase/glucosamine-1-phosphate N-acetyltransferase
MAVRTVPDPERYGVVQTKEDHIIEILEKCQKPPTNLINAGLYVLDHHIFKYIAQTPLSARGEYELTTSMQMFIDDGFVLRFGRIDNVLDIGTKEIYDEIALGVK